MVVHAVDAVPLGVELRQGVSDLGDLGGRSVPDGVGVVLVDSRDPVSETFQVFFDVL